MSVNIFSTEVLDWGNFLYLLLEMGWPFHMVIWAAWMSCICKAKAVCSFQSIGPAPRIKPMIPCSALAGSWLLNGKASPAAVTSVQWISTCVAEHRRQNVMQLAIPLAQKSFQLAPPQFFLKSRIDYSSSVIRIPASPPPPQKCTCPLGRIKKRIQ